jgi:uncharacterized protein YbcV (DUF1398 family)
MNYELKMSERRAKMKSEKSRRDDTLLTVCFSLRYVVALKKSRRDNMSVAEENNTFAIKKSRRDDISVENSTLSIKKSRRDDMSVEGNSTFTIKKSRRDDISVAEENNTFAIKKSRRDDMSGAVNYLRRSSLRYGADSDNKCRNGACTVSSSARKRINDVFDYVIAKGDGARTVSTIANNQSNYINQMKIKVQTMTALIGQFPASAHFQFSIFNFQLGKAEEAENPQPKSRHKLKFKK